MDDWKEKKISLLWASKSRQPQYCAKKNSFQRRNMLHSLQLKHQERKLEFHFLKGGKTEKGGKLKANEQP